MSARQCRKRFGCSRQAWNDAVRRGDIRVRPREMPIEDLRVIGRRTSRSRLKSRLLKERLKKNRCEQCGISEWQGKPLNMQLHHVNGDGTDNGLENFVFLWATATARPTPMAVETATGVPPAKLTPLPRTGRNRPGSAAPLANLPNSCGRGT